MHLLNFDESNLAVHFAKKVTRQCFGQDVCQLLNGVDGFDLHPSFFDALSNVVISHVNKFVAIMEGKILTELNGVLVVDLQSNGAHLLSLLSSRKRRRALLL